MAVEPARSSRAALIPFAIEHAERIPQWVRDEREAFWLAPRSRLPLTAQRVIQWGEAEGERFTLLADPHGLPVGYGELNRLSRDPGTYWLGHLIIDPTRRGCGFGTQLTRLLMTRGFARGARRVTLVVFPDNHTAIRAYAQAGMDVDGYETHHFPLYRRSVRLTRMAISAREFQRRSTP